MAAARRAPDARRPVTAPTSPRPLDLHAVPLEGMQVIEASAGTGKTRTITGLFLRLVMERDVPIEQILVVTYTVAATEELRERIRERCSRRRWRRCAGSAVTDELAAELTARVADRAEADSPRRSARSPTSTSAAIHTIHGFCQRALGEQRLRERPALRRASSCPTWAICCRRSVDDFWRPASSTASCAVRAASARPAGHARRRWRRAVAPAPRRVRICRRRPRCAPDDRRRRYEAACLDGLARAPRATWPAARAAVEALLLRPGLKQATSIRPASVTTLAPAHGRLPARGAAGAARASTQLDEASARARVAGRVEEEPAPRTHAVLGASRRSRAALRARRARRRAAPPARAEDRPPARGARPSSACASAPAARAVVRRPAARPAPALGAGRAAPRSRRACARAGTAALVDEFQDTDPVAVRHRPAHLGRRRPAGLPGRATRSRRSTASAAPTCSRIWRRAQRRRRAPRPRSATGAPSPALVAAVNALFGRASGTVRAGRHPVPARRGRAAAPAARRRRAIRPSRSGIWFLERDDDDQAARRRTRAARRAARGDGGRDRAPAPSRGRRQGPAARRRWRRRAARGRRHRRAGAQPRQGRLVGAALARLGVPSVQQAEDSVFASREAEQLRRVLLAVAEPGRDDVVRAALGTELLGVSGEALVAPARRRPRLGGPGWTPSIATTSAWREHGFGRMFRELLGGARRVASPARVRRRRAPPHQPAAPGRAAAGRGGAASARSGRARAVDGGARRRRPAARARSSSSGSRATSTSSRSSPSTRARASQYPVVFCPFVWDGRLFAVDARRERDVVCHDPAGGRPRDARARGRRAGSPLRVQACREELAEQPAALLRRADARHAPLHHRVGRDRRLAHRRRRSGCCTLRTGRSTGVALARRAART